MLPGFTGICGFLGVASSVTQTDSRTTTATSFANVNFGPDGVGRWVAILVFHHNTSVSPGQTPTATIGGVSATRIAAHSTGNGSGTASGIALLVAQPVGASGTVSVTWGGLSTTIVALATVGYDLSSAFAAAAAGSSGGGVFLTDIPAQGLLLGAVCRANDTAAVTWTNLTEKADESVIGNRRSWGWDFPLASQSGRSVSYTPYSSGQGQNAGLVASFSSL